VIASSKSRSFPWRPQRAPQRVSLTNAETDKDLSNCCACAANSYVIPLQLSIGVRFP
jgi:hypothetical protein